MSSLNHMQIIGEMCDYYTHESNLASLDDSDISCRTCGYWDGTRCSRNGYEKAFEKYV